MLKRGALIGMIAAILGIGGPAAVGSTAVAKPTSKAHARCAKAAKSKAKQAKRRAKCGQATAGPLAEVTSLLRGIPEEHETLGNPDAPVTLQLLRGSRVPGMQVLQIRILPTLIKEFVRPGKLKVEYHSFKSYTPELSVFEEQQMAALAAGQQDKMWYFVELFYYEQGRLDTNGVNESSLRGLAEQVPDSTSPNGALRAATPASLNRSRATRRPATATTGNRPRLPSRQRHERGSVPPDSSNQAASPKRSGTLAIAGR